MQVNIGREKFAHGVAALADAPAAQLPATLRRLYRRTLTLGASRLSTANGRRAAMAEAGHEGGDPGSDPDTGSPGRRMFLRFAAAAGGASLLSACSGNASAPAAGGSTAAASLGPAGGSPMSVRASAAPGPPASADWKALARDLSGPLIRPGESGYTTAKELFDPRFDSLRPAGIAYCRNPHDVATSLAFVRKYGIPMAGVNVSGSTATVGAGTRLIDFYNGLAAHGRAVPGGSCPTVGISGLTLGGGIGVVG